VLEIGLRDRHAPLLANTTRWSSPDFLVVGFAVAETSTNRRGADNEPARNELVEPSRNAVRILARSEADDVVEQVCVRTDFEQYLFIFFALDRASAAASLE